MNVLSHYLANYFRLTKKRKKKGGGGCNHGAMYHLVSGAEGIFVGVCWFYTGSHCLHIPFSYGVPSLFLRDRV